MRYEGFYLYNLDPLIIGRVGQIAAIPAWAKGHAELRSDLARRPILIEHPAWFSGYWLKLLRKKHEAKRFKNEGWSFQLFRNDPIEDQRCRFLRIKGVFASHNAFVDEQIIRPMALQKKYDAIYLAEPKAFNRHALACEIKKLHLAMREPVEPTKIHESLSHASVNKRELSNEEVVSSLNQAHCTLALSREEGAMFACVESLLCGVPVVSTRSRGGRSLFLNSENSIVLERETPEAVAKAVESLKKSPLDPTRIRKRAIQDIQKHRTQMAKHLSKQVCGTEAMAHQFLKRLFTKSSQANYLGDDIFVADGMDQIPDSVRNWITALS